MVSNYSAKGSFDGRRKQRETSLVSTLNDLSPTANLNHIYIDEDHGQCIDSWGVIVRLVASFSSYIGRSFRGCRLGDHKHMGKRHHARIYLGALVSYTGWGATSYLGQCGWIRSRSCLHAGLDSRIWLSRLDYYNNNFDLGVS